MNRFEQWWASYWKVLPGSTGETIEPIFKELAQAAWAAATAPTDARQLKEGELPPYERQA